MATNQSRRHYTSFFISDILNMPNTSLKPLRSIANPIRLYLAPQTLTVTAHGVIPASSPCRSANGVKSEAAQHIGPHSPLDALFKMTNKTFDGVERVNINVNSYFKRSDHDQTRELADSMIKRISQNKDPSKGDKMRMFGIKSQSNKKRRKCRTAFTNQQIYELEKRFLYQKYLTPADRDEIALSLGLTNAQVITWFQNRRAKLKRDLEELKADVTHCITTSDEENIDDDDKTIKKEISVAKFEDTVDASKV